MSRVISFSTVLGLLGLCLSTLAALSGAAPGMLVFGFATMVFGFLGAVIGAVARLGHVLETARS